MNCISYHCFGFPNGLESHSKDFTKLFIIVDFKDLEESSPEIVHHSQATFGSGNPRRNIDITCQPLPDSGQSQIIGVFGISRNILGVIYLEGASNDI